MKKTRTVLYDRDIREPLFDFLEERYGKIRILEEKIIGGARADLIMITPGLLYGIEIKSDADTYTRLKRQTEYYNLFLTAIFWLSVHPTETMQPSIFRSGGVS